MNDESSTDTMPIEDTRDVFLPIPSYFNGGAINLQVDSYLSMLCWLQSTNHPKVVCSDLNGENSTILFVPNLKSEKIVGFTLNPIRHEAFIMVGVRILIIVVVDFLFNTLVIISFVL